MAVSHKNIPDSELHVPKGYGNATLNEVLTRSSDAAVPEWKFLDATNLADNSVGTSELQSSSVTTAKIASNAVTIAKISNFDTEVASVIAPSVAGSNYNVYLNTTQYANTTTSEDNGFYEVMVLGQGTIRIQWNISSSTTERGVTSRLLVNGTAVFSNSTGTTTTYTQDISVDYGDLIRVTFRDDGGLSNIGYLNSFAVQSTLPIPRVEFMSTSG